jgi:hypothetical protein
MSEPEHYSKIFKLGYHFLCLVLLRGRDLPSMLHDLHEVIVQQPILFKPKDFGPWNISGDVDEAGE